MANRCYLEAYAPVSSLEGDRREYWDKYISIIIPKFDNIEEANSSDIEAILREDFKEFELKRYPIKPYCCIDEEYYIHIGDMTFSYCIPDQFLACFDKNDKIETNVNKEEYDALSEEDKVHYDFMYKFFRFSSTAKKAKELLKDHLDSVNKEQTQYIEFGNQILEFLSSTDDNSIISLFSGEVCMEDDIDSILSYIPV